jgi:RND family efflux transporter MFP subunit
MTLLRTSFYTLALMALAACSKHKNGSPQFGAMPVTVAPPTQREIQDYDEFTGRIEAAEAVEIRPRVSGYLDGVHFKSGELVKKGNVLFTIDARPFQAVLDRAEAELRQAETRLKWTKSEAERAERLSVSKTMSTEEADKQRRAHEEASAGIGVAQAAVKAAGLDVEFCTVRAPISGRVSREMVTAGNYVSGVAGFTTLLTTVVKMDPVLVYADVDETTFLRYQRLTTGGQATHLSSGETPAEMQLDGEAGFPHRGHIESFDNRIQGSTGSILLRAEFPNTDGTLRPGSFVRLRLPAGPKYSGLLVTERALGTDQGRKYVLTVGANNVTEYKPVEIGPLLGDQRIIRKGLAATDSVIVNGLQRARPGASVIPEPAKPEEVAVAVAAK